VIIGDIRKVESYAKIYAEPLMKALRFIADVDVESIKDKTSIDGEKIFVSLSQNITKQLHERKAEYHMDYYDVHYCLEGDETVGFIPDLEIVPIVETVSGSDSYKFLDHDNYEANFILSPGMFAVFAPLEPHRTGCSPTGGTMTKKLIIKIHVDLLS
jgi:YhcH/YjgK/YiaL family protein